MIIRLLNAAPRWVRRSVTAITRGRGPVGRLYDAVVHQVPEQAPPTLPDLGTNPVRVLIGPANSAGQGYEWARAMEAADPRVTAIALMAFEPSNFGMRADVKVDTATYLRSAAWHDRFELYLRGCTHVVIESGVSLLGRRYGTDAFAEARLLRDSGVEVGMMFHGSDLRLPSQHLLENPWSPFSNPAVPSRLLEDSASRVIAETTALGCPVFVSTPDLVRYLDGAVWCPLVIEPGRWTTLRADALRTRPVVVHAPTNPHTKGALLVAPALRALDAEGVIEYRTVSGVRHDDMPAVYAEADIVLDQFLVGSYGVSACEAMAAGCIVVGHVDDLTRNAVRQSTGREVAIVDATVDTIGEVVRDLVAESPSAIAARRARAIEYVQAVHDGRRSAEAFSVLLER